MIFGGWNKMKFILKTLALVMVLLSIIPAFEVSAVQGMQFTGQGITDERLAEMVASGEIPESILYLSLTDNMISDLTPLSGLVNLRRLLLSANQISDISPLSTLTDLNFLALAHNEISDLTPLKELENLRNLTIASNPVSIEQADSIQAALPRCEILGVNRNPITNERLATMVANGTISRSETNLSLTYHSISDISSLSDLTNLISLRLSGNQISDITPLAELTNLNILALSRNQITDLTPLANLTNLGKDLGELSLDGNQITSLEGLESLTNLGTLSLRSNQITDVTPLANLTDLWMLDLRNNNIEDVSTLAWLTKLDEHSLMLQGNPVASNPEALRELAEARERNRTRTTLTLGHVLGYEKYQVEDALAILRYVVGLPSVLDDCEVAMMAALVISSEVEGPQIDDALQILRYVVGLSSVLGASES